MEVPVQVPPPAAQPATPEEEAFEDFLLRFMIDDFQQWRERSVERLEPLTADNCRRHISMQFRLTAEFLDRVESRVRRKGLALDRPRSRWTQVVPLARFQKGVMPEFSARLETLGPAKIMSHFDGTAHTRRFLRAHYAEMVRKVDPEAFTPQMRSEGDAIELYLHLIAGSEPTRLRRRLRKRFALREEEALTLAHLRDDKTFGEWLREETKRSVDRPDALPSEDMLGRVRAHLERVERDLVPFKKYAAAEGFLSDPVRNPLFLLRDVAYEAHSLHEEDKDEPKYEDVDAVLQDMLVLAGASHRLLMACLGRIQAGGGTAEQWTKFLREIYMFLYAWIAYTELEMTPDLPVMVKVEMRLNVPKAERVRGAREFYQIFPVPFKDFRSSHIEVRTSEPELELSEPRVVRDGKEESTEDAFRETYESEPDLFHFIASSPDPHLGRAPLRSWKDEFASAPSIERDRVLGIRLKLRAKPAIDRAYDVACLSSGALTLFAMMATGHLLVESAAAKRPSLSTVGTIAIATAAILAIVILFATARHRHPMVTDLTSGRSRWIMGMGAASAVALLLALAVAAWMTLRG